MAINRYTQTSQARYNPRSLQEMMLAPQYMRENHSKLEENMAEHAGLLDEISSYPAHSKAAKAEKERLLSALQERVEGLSTHGFSPQAKSDFMKFSKDYKHSLSPEGTLGRIQAANKSIMEGLEENQKLHKEAKWSPETAKLSADRMLQKYNKNFEETGEIQDIEFEAPPMKQNIEDDFTKLKGLLGSTTVKQSAETLMGNGRVPTDQTLAQLGYMPEIDRASGKIILKSPKGHVLNTENYDQLEGMLKYISDKWLGPMGEGTASDAWEQYDPEQRMADIENLGTSINKSTTENMLGVSRTMASPEKPAEDVTDLPPNMYAKYKQTRPINDGGFEKTKVNAKAKLNDPRSNLRDRTASSYVLVKLDEIEQEWLNSDERDQFNLTGIPELSQKINETYGELLGGDDGQVDPYSSEFTINTNPDGSHTLSNSIISQKDYVAGKYDEPIIRMDLTPEEYEIYSNSQDEMAGYIKTERDFKNNLLNRSGNDMIEWIPSENLTSEKKNKIHKHIAQFTLDSNNMEVLSGNITEKDGTVSSMGDMDPITSRRLMNLLQLEGVEILSANPTRSIEGFGYSITARVKSDSKRKVGKVTLPKGSANINFFTGLTNLNDQYGNRLSHAALIDLFPEEHRDQFENWLSTNHILPVTGKTEEEIIEGIDNLGIPANSIFSESLYRNEDNVSLVSNQYLDESTGRYSSYYVPSIAYTVDSDKRRHVDGVRWYDSFNGIIPNSEGEIEEGNKKQEAFMRYAYEHLNEMIELTKIQNPETYRNLKTLDLEITNERNTAFLILINELNDYSESLSDMKLSDPTQMNIIKQLSIIKNYSDKY